jgi:hypothetical protein
MGVIELDKEQAKATATNQAVNGRDGSGRFAIGNKPTVGFHTNPERRSDGRWRKEDSVTYQYRRMLAMTDDELEAFIPETQAQKIAKMRIMRAVRDDDSSLAETKEITDRTEGKARQNIGIETGEKAVPIIRGFVIPTLPEDFVNKDIRAQLSKEETARVLGAEY